MNFSVAFSPKITQFKMKWTIKLIAFGPDSRPEKQTFVVICSFHFFVRIFCFIDFLSDSFSSFNYTKEVLQQNCEKLLKPIQLNDSGTRRQNSGLDVVLIALWSRVLFIISL